MEEKTAPPSLLMDERIKEESAVRAPYKGGLSPSEGKEKNGLKGRSSAGRMKEPLHTAARKVVDR